jgi:hypothetical protein
LSKTVNFARSQKVLASGFCACDSATLLTNQTIPLQVLNALLTHYTVITADMIALCKNMIIVMGDFYFYRK